PGTTGAGSAGTLFSSPLNAWLLILEHDPERWEPASEKIMLTWSGPPRQKSLLGRLRAMLAGIVDTEETTMRTWVLIALCCALPAAAAAQTYPSKTITIIVPAPPGGVTDVLARTLAQRFTAAWGQQAIVENRPGGNNQVAAEYVTRMPPDGHTLLIGPEVTFIANPALYGKLNYDPINGFTAIVGLVTINHALITHPSLPVANVRELIALAT